MINIDEKRLKTEAKFDLELVDLEQGGRFVKLTWRGFIGAAELAAGMPSASELQATIDVAAVRLADQIAAAVSYIQFPEMALPSPSAERELLDKIKRIVDAPSAPAPMKLQDIRMLLK